LTPRADMSRAWKERPISTFFATGGGIGMIPFAPGTWGSVEGLGIGWLLNKRVGNAFSWFEVGFTGVLVCGLAVGIVGTWAAGRSEAVTAVKDPGPIVIDEVCGQLIASAPATLMSLHSSVWLWLASFLLFRLFDIWKPGLIRKLQDLPGGWGIMLDDVAAGILAGVLTYGIGRVL
jgi:phosphatidylglycerophosphatase A